MGKETKMKSSKDNTQKVEEPAAQNLIKMAEVRKNKTTEAAWFVIDNEVYDVTRYKNHPGQFKILLMHAGTDATKAFVDRGHSESAKKAMKKFRIGTLADPENRFVEDKEDKHDWLLYFDRFWMSAIMFTIYYYMYQAASN